MEIQLSERQRTAVAAAITIVSAVVILCAIAGVFYLIGIFLRRFSHVFLPLAVAGVAALVFNPYYTWLHGRLRLPDAAAVAVVILSILAPLVAFFWFFGALAENQLSDLLSRLPDYWDSGLAWLKARWPRVVQFLADNPWGQRIQTAIEGQQQALVDGLQQVGGRALSGGRVVMRGIGTAVAWAVFPIYFAFFLQAEPGQVKRLDALLPFLKQETRKDLVYLVEEFINMIVAFFRGQLIVALSQGLLFAIGFSLVGLKYGFVLGLALGFLNIIPYLGSIIGLGVAIPIALSQDGGGIVRLALVMLVFTVVQMIEAYVITPKVMGDRTGLHPIAIIVAIFFWGSALDGILGMVLAIPLTAFLVVFWRLARDKYIRELV